MSLIRNLNKKHSWNQLHLVIVFQPDNHFQEYIPEEHYQEQAIKGLFGHN